MQRVYVDKRDSVLTSAAEKKKREWMSERFGKEDKEWRDCIE